MASPADLEYGPLVAYALANEINLPPNVADRIRRAIIDPGLKLSLYHADKIAVEYCNVHPCAIWGNEYFKARLDPAPLVAWVETHHPGLTRRQQAALAGVSWSFWRDMVNPAIRSGDWRVELTRERAEELCARLGVKPEDLWGEL